jgi:AcrR family transcriptional regulator
MGRPKKNLHDQGTESRLLEAAEREFGRVGFSAARLEDIAHFAQVQRSSLLYHFESKDALYAAVVRHSFSHLAHLLQTSITAQGTFEERVDLLLESFLGFLSERPSLASLILREVLDGVGPGHELLLAAVVPLLEVVDSFMDTQRPTWQNAQFPAREAVLMIATSAMVRTASSTVEKQLWGNKNSIRQLAKTLLLGVQHGPAKTLNQPEEQR